MVKFSDKHKQEQTGKYFSEGVHEVKIGFVEFDQTDDGREFADFSLTDNAEREAKVRFWFHTDGAINYSFNIIKGIFVHNAPEDKKDAIRAKVEAAADTEELAKLCSLLIGKDAWLEVARNPKRDYRGNDGNMKKAYDSNIYGYEPTPKAPVAAAASTDDAGANTDPDDIMAGF